MASLDALVDAALLLETSYAASFEFECIKQTRTLPETTVAVSLVDNFNVTCNYVTPNKVFPKPAFTTIEELQRMSVREIVCGSVGKFGSTSGTEICSLFLYRRRTPVF